MEDDWELVGEERIRGGHLPLVSRTLRHPAGPTSSYEILDQRPVVCILAITAADEAVVVRQFRPGPDRYCTELPAGFIDPDESPPDAASRELAEETGYRGSLRPVARLFSNGYSTEVRHVFVCTDAVQVGAPTPDPGEHLEVLEVPVAQLRSLLRSGEMTVTDAAYVGLDELGLLG